jgi:large conductance mechanosensitive channel
MKLPFSGLWGEFKAFAFQGNMIELAVAVVIGAAFSQVINAMVKDLVNPAIGYAMTAAKEVKDKSSEMGQSVLQKTGLTTSQPTTMAAVVAPPAAPPPPPAPAPAAPAPKPAEPQKVVDLDWKPGGFPIGDLIGEFLNFIIKAFAVFILIVKLIGGTVKRVGSKPKPGEPTTKECPECLSIIPIKARRCSHCTAILEPAPGAAVTAPTV